MSRSAARVFGGVLPDTWHGAAGINDGIHPLFVDWNLDAAVPRRAPGSLHGHLVPDLWERVSSSLSCHVRTPAFTGACLGFGFVADFVGECRELLVIYVGTESDQRIVCLGEDAGGRVRVCGSAERGDSAVLSDVDAGGILRGNVRVPIFAVRNYLPAAGSADDACPAEGERAAVPAFPGQY